MTATEIKIIPRLYLWQFSISPSPVKHSLKLTHLEVIVTNYGISGLYIIISHSSPLNNPYWSALVVRFSSGQTLLVVWFNRNIRIRLVWFIIGYICKTWHVPSVFLDTWGCNEDGLTYCYKKLIRLHFYKPNDRNVSRHSMVSRSWATGPILRLSLAYSRSPTVIPIYPHWKFRWTLKFRRI